MERLKLGSIPVPELYVVKEPYEIVLCQQHRIPYIIWDGDMESLVKLIFLPVLKKKFPYIKWEESLGLDRIPEDHKEIVVNVTGTHTDKVTAKAITSGSIHDVAEEERLFSGKGKEIEDPIEVPLDAFIGTSRYEVDVEVLQSMRLLPHFMDDIVTNITKNFIGGHWNEGYNKKRGVTIGNFTSASELPNLIILDVSGSIPEGISATMISLIDTLRSHANADLIITASMSKFYPIGSKLPSPHKIRSLFGYGNERTMFTDILNKKVLTKRYGNIIGFGDFDTPHILSVDLHPTMFSCNEVWHYHTGITSDQTYSNEEYRCGYLGWIDTLCPEAKMHFDRSWCKLIEHER